MQGSRNILFRPDAETDGKSSVNSVHITLAEIAHFLSQPLFVKRSYLFKQHYGILGKAAAVGVDPYVRGQARFEALARYRRGDNGRTEFISDIVLDYQHRSCSALLRADDGT